MSDILKLLRIENRTKIKILGWEILVYLVYGVAVSIPIGMASSRNGAISFLGNILLLAGPFVAVGCFIYLFVNKILAYYYPNLQISFGDAVKKGIAGTIILVIIYLLFIFVFCPIIGILAFINETLAMFLVVPVAIIGLIPVLALTLILIYVVIENVEYHQRGFVAVFAAYLANWKRSRKACTKIAMKIVGTTILMFLVLSIVIGIIVAILTMINPVAVALGISFLYSITAVLAVWYTLTLVVYVLQCYATIRNLPREI
ncbi:hypothetical protein RZE82_04760 [Mollicutes bacterium LVI A0039]|nr:hypothetical protein RZE82_04760 [Mollicutes bacterium LVI A0039]